MPAMVACFEEWHYSEEKGLTQQKVCDKWGIDPRELRDYTNFRRGFGSKIPPVYQSILNSAYNAYREHFAIRPIQSFIRDAAPLYGVKARPVVELWEVDPFFYPSDYVYPRD